MLLQRRRIVPPQSRLPYLSVPFRRPITTPPYTSPTHIQHFTQPVAQAHLARARPSSIARLHALAAAPSAGLQSRPSCRLPSKRQTCATVRPSRTPDDINPPVEFALTKTRLPPPPPDERACLIPRGLSACARPGRDCALCREVSQHRLLLLLPRPRSPRPRPRPPSRVPPAWTAQTSPSIGAVRRGASFAASSLCATLSTTPGCSTAAVRRRSPRSLPACAPHLCNLPFDRSTTGFVARGADILPRYVPRPAATSDDPPANPPCPGWPCAPPFYTRPLPIPVPSGASVSTRRHRLRNSAAVTGEPDTPPPARWSYLCDICRTNASCADKHIPHLRTPRAC